MFNSYTHIPMMSKDANMIFNNPIKYINHRGSPYTENSSFIEFASPPRYNVFLLNRNSHTFKSVSAIIALIRVVSNIMSQK